MTSYKLQYRQTEGGNIKDLVYHQKDTLGLDIGTSAVKFVQLKNAGKLTKLVGYGKVDLPENYIFEGIISEPEKLAELLKKALSEPPWGKITAKRVVASLPEAKMFTRIIDLPVLGLKEIEEAVKYEVEQSIPVPASDLYVDWQIITEDSEKTTVFLAAAPRSIVDSYMQLFQLLEMEPDVIELSLAAIARSMVSNKTQTEPVIILDIGGQATNMAIFDSNLRVTSSFPMGGTTMKNSVAEALGVSEKETAQLVRAGITKDSKAADIIKKDLEKMSTEVQKIIDYFLEKNEKAKVSQMLLCGGLGFLPGLPEYFKEKNGLESKVGNPWVNISIYPLKPVPKEEAPGYATAIGLSLRGLEDD